MAVGTIPTLGPIPVPDAVPHPLPVRMAGPGLAAQLADALAASPVAARLRWARTRLEDGTSAVERIDLADAPLRIGELIELLGALPVPPDLPARAGDWGAILGGRAAALASARVVCATLRAGRPLLSESTYTETAAGDAGDVLFRPATIYDAHGPQRLTVCAGGGPPAAPAEESASWLTAFVDTCGDTGSVPLHAVHRRRNARLSHRIDYVADRLLADPARLRELLHAVLLAAESGPDAPSRLGYVCGGLADTGGAPRAGRLVPAERGFGTLRPDRTGYALGSGPFGRKELLGRDELVERMLLPLLAVRGGNTGRPQLDAAPGTLVPLLAGPVRTLLLAWMDGAADRRAVSERFLWRPGGASPAADGYSRAAAAWARDRRGGRAGRQAVTPLADRVSRSAQVPPTLLLSAPTEPFGLLPRRSRRLDYALVRELFRQVTDISDDRLPQAVAGWYARRGPSLSAAYRSRILGARRDTRNQSNEVHGAQIHDAAPRGYAFDDAEEDMSGSDVGAVPELLSMTFHRACRVSALLRRAARI